MSVSTLDSARTHGPNPELDLKLCSTIGERLSKIRSERNLSVNDLSSTLLLSVRQVRALEAADVSAFHNASFFMIALRKYAALCGIDRATVDAAVVAAPEVVQVAVDLPDPSRDSVSPSRNWTPVVAVLGVCVVLALGWGVFRWSRSARVAASSASTASATESTDRADASLPAQPTDAASTAAASAPEPGATPPDSVTTAPPGEVPAVAPPPRGGIAPNGQIGYGMLWSPQRAWLFLRLEDDTVIERTVNAGELVELPTKPKYLAIGSDEAELTIGFAPVDVSRFVQKGTLRMGVAEFGLAEQAAFSDLPVGDNRAR